MEAARKLKVNLKLEGKPCRSCERVLVLAEDAKVCTTCSAEHHAACWDGKGGCATAGCVNAPIKRFDVPAAPSVQPRPYAPYTPGGQLAPLGLGTPMAAAPAYAPQPAYGQPVLGPGMMLCFHCRRPIMATSNFCPFCTAPTSPDGLYHGPKTTAPGATASLVLGILSLFLFGITSPFAIMKSNEARREIAMNPTFGGGGVAMGGLVTGILGLVFWGYVLLNLIGGGEP
jgi:hypothetical protein